MMFRVFIINLLAVATVIAAHQSFADTVIMKDGRKVKGLILDEYKDRVVVSTVYGETTLMKGDIRSAFYSSEEKSLMRKAESLLKSGQEMEAYHMYSSVLELDPDNRQAEERLNYLKSFIEITTRQKLSEKMDSRQDLYPGGVHGAARSEVEKYLGLYLEEGEKNVFVGGVDDTFSDFYGDSIEPGDRVVKVWGDLTAFMDTEEVSRLLLVPGEVRLTVERDVFPELSSGRGILGWMPYLKYKTITGASLKLYKEGITVKGVISGGPFGLAGITDGDVLWRITGRNTRYMPMPEAVSMIIDKRGETIDIVIRRDVKLWRKADKK